MGCATTTVKISSILFNTILAFLGFGAIGWIAFNPEAMREEYAIASYIVCSLIVVFSFLGCFAAIRESVCLTATCAVFLLILAILQIITTCLNINSSEKHTGLATVNTAWDNDLMDALQADNGCCGKISAQDYVVLEKPIPPSCYAKQNTSDFKYLYVDGCISKLQDYYDNESVHLAIVSWVLIAFELLGFLLAVFLVINFRNTQRRMQF